MEEILRLNEFFVEGGHPDLSHVLLHITEPSTPEEKAKGYFFAVCEINQGNKDFLQTIQSVITDIENNYYELSDKAGSDSLETILEEVNQTLPPRPNLHCLIGVIRNQEIIFSFTGRPLALFFYKNRDGQYQKMDLVNSSEPGADADNQLFSQVVQGKISPGDYLCIGTPQFADYFSADRLQKIITTRPPRQSAEHLERVLKELRNQSSFGGLIMQLSRQEATTPFTPRPRPKREDSAHSLTSFFSTEKNTAATLTASWWPQIQEKISTQLRKMSSAPTGTTTPRPELAEKSHPKAEISSSHLRPYVSTAHGRDQTRGLTFNTDLAWRIAGVLWQIIRWIGTVLFELVLVLGSLVASLGKNLILLGFVIINYQGRRKNIIEDWGKQYQSLRSNLAELPLITKILTLGVIVIMLIFGGSLFVLRVHQKKAAALATYNTDLKAVSDKIDSAKSTLVYGDEIQALHITNEAEALLKALPCTEKDTKIRCDAFNADLESIRVKVRKITPLSPELLTTWALPAGVRLTGLLKLNNQFLAYAPTNPELFSHDISTGETKAINLNYNLNGIAIGAIPKENDYGLLLATNGDLLRFEPADGTVKKLDISYPHDNPTISGFTIYNRRLYTLDSNNRQIYKHDTMKTGFGPGKDWLKDPSGSLQGGSDIAIDGDIWTISNTGEINKFVSGLPESFEVLGLDPALGEGTRLYTYTDLNFIYILDGKNKRIIIADKAGKLKTQLVANAFENPSDMVIDEAARVGYAVDGAKLYKFSLPL